MQSLILVVNVVLSLLLIILILIQRTNTDAGGAFSSDSSVTAFKRRGFELTIYRATIVVAILFAVSLGLHAFLPSEKAPETVQTTTETILDTPEAEEADTETN